MTFRQNVACKNQPQQVVQTVGGLIDEIQKNLQNLKASLELLCVGADQSRELIALENGVRQTDQLMDELQEHFSPLKGEICGCNPTPRSEEVLDPIESNLAPRAIEPKLSFPNSREGDQLISKTPEMSRLFDIIRVVSPTNMTVLIKGETGTGKKLVASAIHYQSPRRDGPFITIDCAGSAESLQEGEFGHEGGTLAGEDHTMPGKIELAHRGTLFLDDIESISPVMQSKLLCVLENRNVERLGENRPAQIDMRVIAATKVPLEELVAQGRMRSDFYYRINVIPINLVPLRERREDIPLLVDDFLRRHPLAMEKKITGISRRMLDRLVQYPWPGNIRELQNVLERAIVRATGGVIEVLELPDITSLAANDRSVISRTSTLDQWLKEQEKQYLMRQLEALEGKIALTAKRCGLGIRTLSRKMRLYGLHKHDFQKQASEASRGMPSSVVLLLITQCFESLGLF